MLLVLYIGDRYDFVNVALLCFVLVGFIFVGVVVGRWSLLVLLVCCLPFAFCASFGTFSSFLDACKPIMFVCLSSPCS